MLLGMRAWPAPDLPSLPVQGPEVTAFDTAAGELRPLVPADGTARLYVCGITPYDATHLGHANTYLAFDLLNRAWRNAGHNVRYAQNVTDVDDPLLERADRDGIDWHELAARETDLFRVDMTALRMLPPDYFIGVAESVDEIGAAVGHLVQTGAAYRVDDDVYYDISSAPAFGQVSHLDQAAMRPVFAERGGDPDRPGKRNPLDALLWRAERPGEPSWPSPVGPGRPGWHIECTVIAREHLGPEFDVQGGGSDLVFPHHEMSAAHLETGRPGRGSPGPTFTPGWWDTTARRCRSRAATWCSSRACVSKVCTRWRFDWPCCPTTTAATGSGPNVIWIGPLTDSPVGAPRPAPAGAPPVNRSSPR